MSSYGFSPLSLYIPFGIGRAAGWPDLFLLNNKIFLLYKFFTGNRNCLTIKGCLRIPKKKEEKTFCCLFFAGNNRFGSFD